MGCPRAPSLASDLRQSRRPDGVARGCLVLLNQAPSGASEYNCVHSVITPQPVGTLHVPVVWIGADQSWCAIWCDDWAYCGGWGSGMDTSSKLVSSRGIVIVTCL